MKVQRTGFFGIWNGKKFVYGVQEPSRSRAARAMYKRFGKNALQNGYEVRPILNVHAKMFHQVLRVKEVTVNE